MNNLNGWLKPRVSEIGQRPLLWVPGIAGLVLATALIPVSLRTEPRPPVEPVVNGSMPQWTLAQTFQGDSPIWTVMANTQDGGPSLVIGGEANGHINVWNRKTGDRIHRLVGHGDAVRALAISDAGHWLVSGGGDGLKVWRLETGELLYGLPVSDSPIWSVTLSPDNRTLVGGDYAGNIMVWDFSTGERLYSNNVGGPVWALQVTPDGKSLFSGSSDRTVRQWDIATGTLLQEFTGHTDAVRTLAISPDGQTLASGSWDSTIKLWDIATGAVQATLSGHSDRVVALAVSADGKTLASGSVDNTLKLWDLTHRELIQTLANTGGWILSTDFDGQTLISGGKEQPVKVWQ